MVSLYRSLIRHHAGLQSYATAAELETLFSLLCEQALAQRSPTLVLLGMQRFSRVQPMLPLLRELAAAGQQVLAFGVPDSDLVSIPGVTWVPVPPAASLAHESFLILNRPTCWTALMAHEMSGPGARADMRHFECRWTFESQAVADLAALLGHLSGAEIPLVRYRVPAMQQQMIVSLHQALQAEQNRLQTLEGHRERQHGSLHRFADTLADSFPLQLVNDCPIFLFHRLLPLFQCMLAAQETAISFVDAGGTLQVVAMEGGKLAHSVPVSPGMGTTGLAHASGQLVLQDVTSANIADPVFPQATAVLALPLFASVQVQGVVTVAQGDWDWNDEDLLVGQAAATMLSEALSHGSSNASFAPRRDVWAQWLLHELEFLRSTIAGYQEWLAQLRHAEAALSLRKASRGTTQRIVPPPTPTETILVERAVGG